MLCFRLKTPLLKHSIPLRNNNIYRTAAAKDVP
jgi:hypothetical protein